MWMVLVVLWRVYDVIGVSVELAMIMGRLYGGVCYAGIDTDPELKYPKGAGRVAFSNQQSYIAAISARFIQLQHGDLDKRVSLFLCLSVCLSLSLSLFSDCPTRRSEESSVACCLKSELD